MDGFRKWLTFGTGVGIEVRDNELQVTIVRARPSETGVLGSATVTDFKTRPAAEWGAELIAFLKKLGAAHIATTVLLPRHDVIVRSLQMPGVSDRDLEAAIRLQIDSLHPFAEDDVYFSFARVGKTANILVGISRREVVDALSTMFAEAGIKVASLTFSTAAIYSAIRLIGPGPQSGFVTVYEWQPDIEIYGESEAKPVFAASFPPIGNRAIALAVSELRLEPGTEPVPFVDLLPKPTVFPANHDPSTPAFTENALAYATAVSGACPWLSLDGNLLPPERRRSHSRARLIPTFSLATILVLMLGALAAQSKWADGRYLGVLQHEIRKHEPKARQLDTLDKRITDTRTKTQLLDDYRRRAKHDMDALAEITKLIPPPGWVGSLELDRNSLQIAGETDQAEGLLKSIDASPLFEKSEFTMPITRTPGGQAFRIRALRTVGGAPVGGAPAAEQSVQETPAFYPQQQPVSTPPPTVAQPVLPPGFVQSGGGK